MLSEDGGDAAREQNKDTSTAEETANEESKDE
jgi:hypothetical protein